MMVNEQDGAGKLKRVGDLENRGEDTETGRDLGHCCVIVWVPSEAERVLQS